MPYYLKTIGGLCPDSSQNSEYNSVEISDACRPSHDRTLLFWTGLSEPGELARLPFFASDQTDETGGASLVLPTFAETKVGRLPGRNPATRYITPTPTQRE
ncbi:hypothetical protein [Nitrospira sp.]|uniref:hypothetical protein n=1 Tax=Nitrospira sp. TaxID=70125 RepID=UPI003FCC89CB